MSLADGPPEDFLRMIKMAQETPCPNCGATMIWGRIQLFGQNQVSVECPNGDYKAEMNNLEFRDDDHECTCCCLQLDGRHREGCCCG